MRTAWICLSLYLKPPLLDSFDHMVIKRFYTNQSIWIQLEKGWDAIKLGSVVKKLIKMGQKPIMDGVVNKWDGSDPSDAQILDKKHGHQSEICSVLYSI